MAHWLWQHPDQPYFVSDARLRKYKNLKPTKMPWALDSGGFTEVMREGKWVSDPSDYATRIRRYAEEITHLEWAAPQDWMCGAKVIKRTGLTVAIHQERTIDSVLFLKSKDTLTHIPPVLQGQTVADFLRHCDAYEARGIDLGSEPVVGLGSIFNRQADPNILRLMRRLYLRGIKVHAFGWKLTGLRKAGPYLASSDSLSWSYQARRTERDPACENFRHQNCGNCYTYAKNWLKALKTKVPLDENTSLIIGRHGFGGPGSGEPG